MKKEISAVKLFGKISAILISLALLAVPFFWFKYPMLDLGGDSSRLYFFDPWSWLKNIALYAPNSLTALGTDNPNFSMIPFLSLLVLLKKLLLNNPYYLNCFFSGFLLSGSFVFTFLSLSNLLPDRDNDKTCSKEISSIVGALFFSLSPLIIYEWQKALYSFNQILVYPLVLFFLIRFIKTAKYKYLYLGGITTFIFSVNFSFPTFPWFFSFFSFSFLFLYYYSRNLGRIKVYKKGLFVFTGIFLSLQLFHLIPQIANVLNFSNPNSRAIFDNASYLNRGLQYFLSVQPYVRLTYTWLNQPQFNLPTTKPMYEFGLRYRYLFYIYICLVLMGGIIVKKIGSKIEKKLYAVICAFFLILSFLMTANINNFLLEFYKFMFNIPGFSMFRSYYTKFGMTFVFFYAMLLTYSLVFILNYFKNVYGKIILIVILLSLIVFNGWPLLSGKIVNAILSQSKNVKLPIEMDQNYLEILNLIKEQELDSKYLSFPLTNEPYQIVQGKEGGAYFGPSITGILAGKNDFCGQESFGPLQGSVMTAIEDGEIETIRAYLSLLGIRYIYHNQDNYIYDNFGGYPYSEEFKKIFPSQETITKFINKLGYQKIFQKGSFNFYIDDSNYLPHLYVSENVSTLDYAIDNLSEIIASLEWKKSSSFILSGQNTGKRGIEISQIPFKNTILEYKKINPSKYRLIIHHASSLVPLVFSEEYHPSWKLYLKNSDLPKKILPTDLSSFNVSEANVFDQATKEELAIFLKNGWISSLGKDKTEIGFISRNFQQSIYNSNLNNGNILETQNSHRFRQVSQDRHYKVNGYANLWMIDTSELCKSNNYCQKNEDGSYNIEAVIEFSSQKYLYYGIIFSVLCLLVCLIGAVYPVLEK